MNPSEMPTTFKGGREPHPDNLYGFLLGDGALPEGETVTVIVRKAPLPQPFMPLTERVTVVTVESKSTVKVVSLLAPTIVAPIPVTTQL